MDKFNYFENPKKYNKVLWKFLVECSIGGENVLPDKMPDTFTPDIRIEGASFLDWVVQAILESSNKDHEFEIITSRKKKYARILIRDWYDQNKPKGYVVIIDVSGDIYPEVLYNTCISFILRTK